MSTALHEPRKGRPIESPADLQRVMGTPYAPSEQQWRAISAPLEPAVVIAGAGSGKTTLMAARVVYLVVTGQVRPEEVLGLTFTTKAASELRRRIRDALVAAGALAGPSRSPAREADPEAEILEPTVATYNAYAATLLTEHGLRIGHEPDTRVVTDAARYQLGARVVDRFTGDVKYLTDHPATAIQNLLALDGQMSEHLVSAAQVRAFDEEARAGFERARADELGDKARKTYLEAIDKAISAIDRRAELLDLVADYRRLKADLGLMDFSDQIELGARLAAQKPEVGEAERARFKVVLLDEYQDTSVAQALMLSRLFSGGHPVTAVGDPNQAIYGWRGASVSNILNFGETFPVSTTDESAAPGLYHLTVSRRSDTRILKVANRLAAPLYERYDQVEPLATAPGAGAGVVEVAVHETHGEELAALAESVIESHREGLEAGRDWSDIGVLTRDNSHAEDVFDALTGAGIPVEIVGLKGLLRLPEVAEVVATLHLLHDVTANAAMLTLLTGPRWAIGPRDLRLLGRRAAELAGRELGRAESTSITDQLVEIADGIDPAEVPALDDALADPGDTPFSEEARERFALLSAELRQLRGYVGEPLLDLVRRIMEASGVDVELAAAVSPAAAARRDNLDLFVKAVADFQAVDGDVTLPALLAYLTAEDDQGNGLDLATPSEADSVKLLTVHRAKGLEWASVYVVGACETRFPSNRSRTLWVSSPSVLPAPLRGDAGDLPQLAGFDKAALDAYRAATRAHDAEEELRLGYVAFTRAAHRLSVSSYCWSTRTTPFGPSDYQRTIKEAIEDWGGEVPTWREKPVKGDPNPYDAVDPSRPWPPVGPGAEAQLRIEAARLVAAADPSAPDEGLDLIAQARVAEWDDEIDRLLAEARRDRASEIAVSLPSSLSATAVARLRDDPDAFARDLARPMPRRPAPAARFGTRFHAWVETRFGQQTLLDPDELSGRGDSDVADDAELAELIDLFESGEFADRVPVAVEPSFAIVLGGQVVRGRIDAVYDDRSSGAGDEQRYLVVDWKTSASQSADPLQLAIYRMAWAELRGIPLERVRAAFYYVRTGRLVEPELPGRDEVVALVTSLDL
ncbi:ATP-dependent DNA helicase [Nocardioides sp. GXZ039]|uniref:ATP-dependent DNA helicase n=1 Tax=Nocardioides sp. GXZ039 TaxID=3136018 RepID=UPI0030F4640A